MAECGSVYQDSVVCRYCLSGTCYEGDLCPFSHDPTRSVPDSVCRYYLRGHCFFGFKCKYDHILLNDRDSVSQNERLAEKPVSTSHIEKCKKEMEFSIAIERSLDKTCGICMDVILEKEPESERRFGLLEKCNHVYCFQCIRQWWNSIPYQSDDALDPVVTRACPQCRLVSDFVTPSLYFLDAGEEKQKFINEYKEALSNMPCKYFKQSDSMCPFGGACFYLHARRDGTKVELPLPIGRSRQNQNSELDSLERIALEYGEEIPQLDTNLMSETDYDSTDISDNSYFSDYSETTQNQNGDVDSIERLYLEYRQDFSELVANLISDTDDHSSDISDNSYFSDYSETTQNQNGDVDSIEILYLEYRQDFSELVANLISDTDDHSSDISDNSYFSDYSETTQNQNGDVDSIERIYLEYRQDFSELVANWISDTDDDSSDSSDSSSFSVYSEP